MRRRRLMMGAACASCHLRLVRRHTASCTTVTTRLTRWGGCAKTQELQGAMEAAQAAAAEAHLRTEAAVAAAEAQRAESAAAETVATALQEEARRALQGAEEATAAATQRVEAAERAAAAAAAEMAELERVQEQRQQRFSHMQVRPCGLGVGLLLCCAVSPGCFTVRWSGARACDDLPAVYLSPWAVRRRRSPRGRRR